MPARFVAKVVKFDVVRIESPAFEGRTFGATGTYDRIIARATIAVSPDDPHNSVIADIDRAPRNAAGLVEATTEVEILRPTVAANGNRRLFYEALNRGNKLSLALFNDHVTVNEPAKAADAGNGFLMNRGYTVVWSGWQGDVVPGGGRMRFSPPVVAGVTGLAREDFIFDNTDDPIIAPLSYPAADLDPAKAKISVRAARGRCARHSRRPVICLRGRRQDLDPAPGRFRRRRDLRIHLSGERPQDDGPRFRRHPRRRLVPAQRDRAPAIPSPAGSTAPSAGARRRAAATCTTTSISASTPMRPAA